jgi:hypothetical protein
LFNLPDNIEHPKMGGLNNLKSCQKYCQEAYAIFINYKQLEQANIMNNMLQDVQEELLTYTQ